MKIVLSEKVNELLTECIKKTYTIVNPHGYALLPVTDVYEEITVTTPTFSLYEHTASPQDIINNLLIENKSIEESYLESIEYFFGYTKEDYPDDIKFIKSGLFASVLKDLIATIPLDGLDFVELEQVNTLQQLKQ